MIRTAPPAPGQTAKVLPFPRRRTSSPFDELTAALVLKRHREGTLDPAVVEALLAGVGFHGA
jgi:hypothetical protein